jgi:hypothetical protein
MMIRLIRDAVIDTSVAMNSRSVVFSFFESFSMLLVREAVEILTREVFASSGDCTPVGRLSYQYSRILHVGIS